MTRPLLIAAAVLLLLLLTGCYNLIVVNVGVANKSAAALAYPMDAKTFCEALATGGIDLSWKGDALEQAQQFCGALAAKKKGKS
jgi:hypothetical protein